MIQFSFRYNDSKWEGYQRIPECLLLLRVFCKKYSRVWRSSLKTDITFLYFFLFFNYVIVVLRCNGITKTSRDSNFVFINYSTLSMPYFLDNSSTFIILAVISAPVAMFRATPRKGSPQSFKLPIRLAVCSSCFLISQSIDSL